MIKAFLWQLFLTWAKSALKEEQPVTREVIREENDSIVEFLIGTVIGLATGGILAMLFAPRTGRETRQSLQGFCNRFPSQVRDEIQDPEGKTRSFIGKTIINIENQVEKVSKAIQAGRMADAKNREEMASGVESSGR
jgi:gas vesicle protein